MAAPAAVAPLDRVYGVTNIKTHVLFLLDLDDGNYDAWRELFMTHCQSFDVAGHALCSRTTMMKKLGQNVMALLSFGSTEPSPKISFAAHLKLVGLLARSEFVLNLLP